MVTPPGEKKLLSENRSLPSGNLLEPTTLHSCRPPPPTIQWRVQATDWIFEEVRIVPTILLGWSKKISLPWYCYSSSGTSSFKYFRRCFHGESTNNNKILCVGLFSFSLWNVLRKENYREREWNILKKKEVPTQMNGSRQNVSRYSMKKSSY